jgi:hypothetical protein
MSVSVAGGYRLTRSSLTSFSTSTYTDGRKKNSAAAPAKTSTQQVCSAKREIGQTSLAADSRHASYGHAALPASTFDLRSDVT